MVQDQQKIVEKVENHCQCLLQPLALRQQHILQAYVAYFNSDYCYNSLKVFWNKDVQNI